MDANNSEAEDGKRAHNSSQSVEVNEESENPSRSSPVDEYLEFLRIFVRSKGGPHLVVLIFVLSAALGSVAGLVPDVMGDRYARLNHGWNGPQCSSFDAANKPTPCEKGSDDSQSAAALSEFVKNVLTLFLNTAIASWSDAKGRKGMDTSSDRFLRESAVLSCTTHHRAPQLSLCWVCF